MRRSVLCLVQIEANRIHVPEVRTCSKLQHMCVCVCSGAAGGRTIHDSCPFSLTEIFVSGRKQILRAIAVLERPVTGGGWSWSVSVANPSGVNEFEKELMPESQHVSPTLSKSPFHGPLSVFVSFEALRTVFMKKVFFSREDESR